MWLICDFTNSFNWHKHFSTCISVSYIFTCLLYFLVYKSIRVRVDPRFSSHKQWYFWKLVYKSTPMIDDTKQNKIEGIKDKKQ